MPSCYKIDKNRKLVMSTGYGVVTKEDVLDHQNRILGDPEFDPSFSQLLDFTNMTRIGFTSADVHLFASRNVFSASARRAIVVPDEVTYGLARMFEILRESKGEMGIRVYRTLEEGLNWVFDPQGSEAPAGTETGE